MTKYMEPPTTAEYGPGDPMPRWLERALVEKGVNIPATRGARVERAAATDHVHVTVLMRDEPAVTITLSALEIAAAS